MRLTDREVDKPLVSVAAMVARDRLGRGLRLNYPEAVAYSPAASWRRPRDGARVAELMGMQGSFLKRGDALEGIPEMIDSVQVEATFPDGTKLVTLHNPIP